MDNDDDASSLRLAHPLAFLWAPFLLIHLGGQDTITAFAIEDNSLWLRHLLNLLVQVTLALYVFWKSSSWHNTQAVLVPGILLFVAGIIKYGERTAALRHGNLNNLVISRKSTTTNNNSSSSSTSNNNNIINNPDDDTTLTSIIRDALRSAKGIRMLFASHKTQEVASELRENSRHMPSSSRSSSTRAFFKLMDVELGMMYNDVYTKAAVLRTRCGIVFRCISLACTIAALIFFYFFTNTINRSSVDSNSKQQGYATGRVDTTITYTLFIGGLVVDVCSLLTMLVASPWTWAWLQARGHRRIASMSMCLLSCDMVSGWRLGTTTRPLWSNTMGQYRMVYYDNYSEPPTLSERVMGIVRKQVGTQGEKKLFWLSKLLETKDVAVDDDVAVCLVNAIHDIFFGAIGGLVHVHQWPVLGPLLREATLPKWTNDFARFISLLHVCTEVLLYEAAVAAAAPTMGINIAPGTAAAASANVCRKLSRYMVYLVAAHPASASLLQVVSSNPETEFQHWKRYPDISWTRGAGSMLPDLTGTGFLREVLMNHPEWNWIEITEIVSVLPRLEMWQTTLEELKHMWARLLVYAAAKSRPEAHAAALARGGELLTFVWLASSHSGIGVASAASRVDLVPEEPHASQTGSVFYAFNNLSVPQQLPFPPQQQPNFYPFPPQQQPNFYPFPQQQQPNFYPFPPQ